MKRFLAFLTIFGCIFLQAIALGAEEIPSDALRFKEEYELINGQMNLSGSHEYKTIEIPEENPFVYAEMEDIERLFTEGTGVLYLGFPECPWCRTLIPVLVEAVQENGFDGDIFYYNALPDRDVRSLDENGEVVVEQEGTETYYRLLELLGDHIGPYEGLDDPSIKRIYFPTTVFVKDGEILYVHIDTVESQTDGYEPLDERQHAELLSILTEGLDSLRAE